MPNDVYGISGRIKNLIAKEDIALSKVGTILVNYHTLFLHELYEFGKTLESDVEEHNLEKILNKGESIPLNIIKASVPKEESPSLHDDVMKAKAIYGSNEGALLDYERCYLDLTLAYGMVGDEFWMEAETVSKPSEDHMIIMKLARAIKMLKYLVANEK
jgi:hypothetical protein